MAVVADLHVHTTNSDGVLTLDALPAAARLAGLDAVAVTDHDRFHPDLDMPVSTRDGLTVIHGIELRVEAGPQRVDLLGYGVEPTVALRDEVDRLQRDRIERGAAIVERVEARLGVDLDLQPREGLGRPHVARAIADHPDAPYDFQGAFDHLIGDGRPCYVARDVPSFERGRALLAESCAFVGLAHPLRYDDPAAALELTAELDAVERWYPYGRSEETAADDGESVDEALVDCAMAEYDLLPTGGSDAHDDRLGLAGLDSDAYQRVRERLPPPG